MAGANPYDGADDALVGVLNNSGSAYTGPIVLTGSGNGGGLFAFDGDGICAYVPASYCSTAPTGYEGPINTFSNIAPGGTTGSVNITGLAAGASTFFSLEGSPASIGLPIVGGGVPEPSTNMLLGGGLALMAFVARRRWLFGRR